MTNGAIALEERFAADRARLVRFCAHLSGDVDAAEDLAQETLIEAWRQADRLTDPAARTPWLFGVARNVCRRWARRRSRELAHRLPLAADGSLDADAWPAADGDVEIELEREELAALLDRALALLPPATRTALIQHYVEELPQAEIAGRLGLSEGAVAVRIHRGKIALRRALMETNLNREATTYGLAGADDGWRETRIWCAHCGRRRLLGRFGSHNRTFSLRCPGCDTHPEIYTVNSTHAAELLAGVTAFKPAFTRVMAWAVDFYHGALTAGTIRCHLCGAPTPLHYSLPPEMPPPWRNARGIHFRSPCCQQPFDIALSALTLWLPEGRRFWREHPRLRMLPEREIEANGRPAVVSSFESLADTARYDVVSDRDTYAVLGIYGAPASA